MSHNATPEPVLGLTLRRVLTTVEAARLRAQLRATPPAGWVEAARAYVAALPARERAPWEAS